MAFLFFQQLFFMATLRLCVRNDRWTQKGNHVQIALSHNGSTVYIATPVKLTSVKQWRDGRVVHHERAADMNKQLRRLLCVYEENLEKVKHIQLYRCRDLKNIITGSSKNEDEARTFADVLQEYVNELREDGRNGYATIMELDGRRFANGVGDVMIDGITPKMMNDYCRWLLRKNLSPATVGIAMRNVKTIVNRAIKLQYVKYDVHPFLGVKIPSGGIREIDIDIDTLNRIRTVEIGKPRMRMVRDLFMLSFYCGGMNLIDIMSADWSGKRVEYVREKTKSRMQSQQKVSIAIPDEAGEIVRSYIGKDGRLDFGYKFTYRNFSHYVSRMFGKLMGEMGITGVVMYSARKTWAQLAMELGVGESTIDYCLGHSDSRRGIIRYYTKVKSRMADDAIRMVIDCVMGRIDLQ